MNEYPDTRCLNVLWDERKCRCTDRGRDQIAEHNKKGQQHAESDLIAER